MTYGVNVQMPHGIVLDTSTISYCIADVFNLSTGQATGSKAYPDYAGFTFNFYQISLVNSPNDFFKNSWSSNNAGPVYHVMSVSYPYGYPIVTWTLSSNANIPSMVLVFAK